ncbi:MAG: hypothetical protein Q9172_000400 [Xanthocarpia lactea]
MLSFTHRKSSSSSQVKVDNLIETPKEKASHRVTSKADPTKAINEAQPAHAAMIESMESDSVYADAQAREESTLENIRLLQHRDRYGNLISMLRPTNTLDGINGQSRRTSYYSGVKPQQRLGSEIPAGYYGNRMSMGRPDRTYVDGNGGNYNQPGQGRRVNHRASSDPMLYGTNNQSVYPTHGYHQSHDTVASASGNESHNTDPWGNSTDPSSENSSIDKIQHGPKPDPAEIYGFNGFGGAPQFQGPILEEHGVNDRAYGEPIDYSHTQNMGNGFPNHNRNPVPPPPPPHASLKPNAARVPIKLESLPTKERPAANGNTDKRKSWLKRRFSRT